MDGQRIIFPTPGEVRLEAFELPPLEEGTVVLRTLYSLVSTGTELTLMHKRYAPGTHWDRWTTYPVAPGYSAVCEVVELGPGVEDLTVGARVAAATSHASHSVVPALHCTPIPAQLEVGQATWFTLAKIAYVGARAAAAHLGAEVLVIGAGPIGQMSLRWASATGARTIVVDGSEARLELARRGGANAVVAGSVSEVGERIRALVHGEGPDVVIDTTGNAAVLESALGLVRTFGRVVLLGDPGTPARQRLTSDVIVRGITIVGAHGHHSTLDPDWDGDRGIHSLFFELVGSGRFPLDGLNTHTFSPAECAEAYRLADERRGETMGILFDWTGA